MEEADVIRIVELSIAKINENLLAAMKLMLESSLTDLQHSHTDTTNSHLKEIRKLKFDEPHQFKKKGNEDQYRFNLKVETLYKKPRKPVHPNSWTKSTLPKFQPAQ